MPTKEIDCLWKLKQLTSKWGIYQHGLLVNPDPRFGYAIDDQARALIVVRQFNNNEYLEKIYLDFILEAIKDGNPRHYFYDDDDGKMIIPDKKSRCSEDALGMMVWALVNTKHADKVEHIIRQATNLAYLRSTAYVLLGLLEGEERAEEKLLVDRLFSAFKEDGSWKWFENYLVYGNSLLPWALWKRAVKRGDNEAMNIAKKATGFLIETCQDNGVPMPIGCNGWYLRGKKKNKYDQQPVDAAYMICCLEQAYLATDDNYYLDWARKWWGWFFGNNTKGVNLIDENGACFDAVTGKPEGINLNQGAESNICFLMAYLSAKRMGIVY